MYPRIKFPSDKKMSMCLDKSTVKKVSMAIVFTCHLGKIKIWHAYPRHRERELRAFSSKYVCIVSQLFLIYWL